MEALRKIPRVNGAVDEDVSIHLHAQVGPTEPLPSRPPPSLPTRALTQNDGQRVQNVAEEYSDDGDEYDDDDEEEEEALFRQHYQQYSSQPIPQLMPSPIARPNSRNASLAATPETPPSRLNNTPLSASQYLKPHEFMIRKRDSDAHSKPPSPYDPHAIDSSFLLDEEYVPSELSDTEYDDTDSTASDTCTEFDNAFDCTRRLSPQKKDQERYFSPLRQQPNDPLLRRRPLDSTLGPSERRSNAKIFRILWGLLAFLVAFVVLVRRKGLVFRLPWQGSGLLSSQIPLAKSLDNVASLVSRLEADFDHLASIIEEKTGEVSTKLSNLESSLELAGLQESLGLCGGPNLPECTNLTSQLVAKNEILKDEVLHRVIEILPLTVPVFYRDNKVHSDPEFEQYLRSLIQAYISDQSQVPAPPLPHAHPKPSPQTADAVVTPDEELILIFDLPAENVQSVDDKVHQPESVLHDFEQRDRVVPPVKKVPGQATGQDRASALHTNYADFETGARILGFLTSKSTNPRRGRLAPGRVFLGWYDILKKPPTHTANKVLMQNNDVWTCAPGGCSLGIHLSRPVVVSEIIVHHQPAPAPHATIYLRPNDPIVAKPLEKYIEKIQSHLSPLDRPTRYLSQFLRATDRRGDRRVTSTTVVRISTSILSFGVAARDVYLGIDAPDAIHILRVEVRGTLNPNSETHMRHIYDAPTQALGQDEAYAQD